MIRTEQRTGSGADSHRLSAEDIDAVIFDLDGVITDTAAVHAASWKRMFDDFLRAHARAAGEPFRPFDIDSDYALYVDGKPRFAGVASFLESRGIDLPLGGIDDAEDQATIHGLGNRKNGYFTEHLAKHGVEVFPASVDLIHALRAAGIRTALVSSSRNALAVLQAAGLTDLFDAIIDGNDLAELGLKGKPAPDLFLLAAERLGATPARAVVVEDAISGVAAGRAGDFGLVLGIDRRGEPQALSAAGADVVVSDLGQVTLAGDGARHRPNARARFGEIEARLAGKRASVFLDYDGTLTPIVARPDLAVLSDEMRAVLRGLAARCSVAIVSGRDRADVETLVGLDDIVYAGSHGFDISGPGGLSITHEQGSAFAAAAARAADLLAPPLAAIPGTLVEPKRFAVAVHFRQVAADQTDAVERIVDDVLAKVPELRKAHGKMVFELRPRFAWDKGKAVKWLLQALRQDGPDVLPFYLGDDLTDEDAFAALRATGVTIFVGEPARTAAHYVLANVSEVGAFLTDLTRVVDDVHDR